jgi:serine/threonine protein kinase
VVLAGEHVVLGRPVAIKLVHSWLVCHEQTLARLRLEAQAHARLGHPAIVACTDMGVTAHGAPYLVSERLSGRSLKEEMERRGPLSIWEAVDHALTVLDALAVAHAAGVIHRDIKPANLFLTHGPPRELRLLDFGVAKVLGDGTVSGVAPIPVPTREGLFVGSPRYCPPEQARGRAVDARSDLYSVAATLYALLAGRAPFDHYVETHDILIAHVREAPRRLRSVCTPSHRRSRTRFCARSKRNRTTALPRRARWPRRLRRALAAESKPRWPTTEIVQADGVAAEGGPTERPAPRATDETANADLEVIALGEQAAIAELRAKVASRARPTALFDDTNNGTTVFEADLAAVTQRLAPAPSTSGPRRATEDMTAAELEAMRVYSAMMIVKVFRRYLAVQGEACTQWIHGQGAAGRALDHLLEHGMAASLFALAHAVLRGNHKMAPAVARPIVQAASRLRPEERALLEQALVERPGAVIPTEPAGVVAAASLNAAIDCGRRSAPRCGSTRAAPVESTSDRRITGR